MNFLIDCLIYPSDIVVFVDSSNKEIKKTMRKHGYDDKDISQVLSKLKKCVNARCEMMKDGLVFIFLKSNVKDFYSKVCHESFHATTFILDRVGVKLKLGISDEAYAYLMGFITAEIFKNIKTI
jgi:hypothetical protein